MTPWRAVWIDEQWTVLDIDLSDGPFLSRTRPDAFAAGLAGVLDAVAPNFVGEGVVILGSGAVALCGMRRSPADDDAIDDDVFLAELARGGWQCNRLSDWSTCTKAGLSKVHVLNTAVLDTSNTAETFPLYTGYPPDLVARLKLWHNTTGSAWRLGPGAAGLAVMGRLDRSRVARKGNIPTTWKVTRAKDGPDDGFEDCYRRSTWVAPRPEHPLPYLHCFDNIRAYIAAAMLCEVSPHTLKHTGKALFDKRRAGWWLVELAPWTLPHMPDPAGYVPDPTYTSPTGIERPKAVRWVTTPTLELLEGATAEGVYGGARILDSWTGPARDYPLRAYAERMRDAYALLDVDTGRPLAPDPANAGALLSALKIVGHKAFGALDSSSSWAYRPHWWYSIVALDRCNRWRKMWRVGQQTGIWPAWIETDAVWYPSAHADPIEAAKELSWIAPGGKPTGIVIDTTGQQLGAFTPKGTRRLKGGGTA